MFTGHEDGVRYLEAILEFLLGKKERENTYLSKLKFLT